MTGLLTPGSAFSFSALACERNMPHRAPRFSPCTQSLSARKRGGGGVTRSSSTFSWFVFLPVPPSPPCARTLPRDGTPSSRACCSRGTAWTPSSLQQATRTRTTSPRAPASPRQKSACGFASSAPSSATPRRAAPSPGRGQRPRTSCPWARPSRRSRRSLAERGGPRRRRARSLQRPAEGGQ